MTKEEFNSVEKLYHFTSFEAACKIVESSTLLFNPLKRMNDINELYRPLAFQHNCLSSENLRKMKALVYKHQQISLTRDCRGTMGFDIPAMWGHYADSGNGVCLIFDRNKFLTTLPKGHKKNIVKYIKANSFSSTIIINDEVANNNCFPDKEYLEFFFKKTKDWSYEQEYRILIQSDSNERIPLSFQDSLIGAIIHNADDVKEGDSVFGSVNYSVLAKHLSNIFAYSSFFDERNLIDHDGCEIWSSNK